MERAGRDEICICIGSAALFGAERRFVKIINRIRRRYPAIKIYLIINYRLYGLMRESSFCCGLIDELDRAGALVVVPDHPTNIFKGKRLIRLAQLLSSSVPFHAILRGRILAYLRSLVGRPATIEVTSPDIAKKIGKATPVFLLERIGRFVCVSPGVRRTLLKELERRGIAGRIAEKVSCAPSPYFEAEEWDEGPKERLVLGASRFIPRKNALLYAEAIKRAAQKLPDWQFGLLGQGEDEGKILAMLENEIAEGRVFVRYVPDTAPYLMKAKLFVSLIEPDNYPSQSVLEAMSAGAALLLSNTGDSYSFLASEPANGRLVELNVEAVADALTEMCRNEDLLDAMGRRSREQVRQRYSADAFVDTMLAQHRLV